MLVFKLQTPVNHPEESIWHSEHSKSFKSRIYYCMSKLVASARERESERERERERECSSDMSVNFFHIRQHHIPWDDFLSIIMLHLLKHKTTLPIIRSPITLYNF
jgi:hypothetical protein